MARISHRLELIEKKIDNLPHQNQVGNAISVSRDDMIVFGARFRQLLANEFGANEIYAHSLEYFRNFPVRYRLFKKTLDDECPGGGLVFPPSI